jgi:SAM-dependent methyltransferase
MGELKKKASQYVDAFHGPSALADEENRGRKAAKIRAILADERVFEKANIRILDIGCSYGHILRQLTPATGFGVGVDMDKSIGSHSGNLCFVRTDAERLPFSDGSFDVVICNHVYEHTDDAARLMAEIRRTLSKDGVCYFAGPNKYELIEPHYRLPFLSWLPRKLADRYMQITGKGNSYPEKPFSPPQVRRLLSAFEVTRYTGKVLRDPVRYAATDILPVASLKRQVALFVYKVAPFFFPGFIYILRKPR